MIDGSNSIATHSSGGMRHNKNKPRIGLVPRFLEAAVARVFWASADVNGGKYPLFNWQKGLSWRETVESCVRHLKDLLDGEWLDPDSGMPHWWHAACNLAMLSYYVATGKGTNDLTDGGFEVEYKDPWTQSPPIKQTNASLQGSPSVVLEGNPNWTWVTSNRPLVSLTPEEYK